MSAIRDELDPGTMITVVDDPAPCVLCLKPTTARSPEGHAFHYACLYPKLWTSVAKQRGQVEAGGAYWSHK